MAYSLFVDSSDVNSPIAPLSSIDPYSENNHMVVVWEEKAGIDRIKSFLDECNNGRIKQAHFQSYPHLYKYAVEHKLINNNSELVTFGRWILTCNPDDYCVAIKDMLLNAPFPLGQWISDPSVKNGMCLSFKLTTESDNIAYDYALFLFDIGIIDEPIYWKMSVSYFRCRLTDFGKRVYLYTSRNDQKIVDPTNPDSQKNHTTTVVVNQYYDQSVNLTDSKAGDIVAGAESKIVKKSSIM